MTQSFESDSLTRDSWEQQCFEAILRRRRNVDREDAKVLVHAAWSIERFRTMAPILVAEELLDNPAVRPGDAPAGGRKMPPT